MGDSSSPESPDLQNKHNWTTRLKLYGSQGCETGYEWVLSLTHIIGFTSLWNFRKRSRRFLRFGPNEQDQQGQPSQGEFPQEPAPQGRYNSSLVPVKVNSFTDPCPQFLRREMSGKLVIFDPLDDGRYICGHVKGVKGARVEMEDAFTGERYKVQSRNVILVSRIDRGEAVYMRSRIFGKPQTGPHTLAEHFV